MSDKSPRQSMKKSGKSLKEKRADKQGKAAVRAEEANSRDKR
jgi:hypothetical protein